MAAHRANLSIQQCIFKPQNKEMSRTDIHIRMVHLLTESKLIKLIYQNPLNFRGKSDVNSIFFLVLFWRSVIAA